MQTSDIDAGVSPSMHAISKPVENVTDPVGQGLLDKTELSPTFFGVATFGLIMLIFALLRMRRPRKKTRSVTVQSADNKLSGTRADESGAWAWELNPAAEAAAKANSTQA